MTLHCATDEWAMPFNKYYCGFNVITRLGKLTNSSYSNTIMYHNYNVLSFLDEKIFVGVIRDLRDQNDLRNVKCSIDEWPSFTLYCTFKSQWLNIVVNYYFSSFLIFCIAVFSQWKRRKMQIMIILAGIVILMLLVRMIFVILKKF